MAVVVFVASILCFIFVSPTFGAGFIIGGSLAFLNYYWLKGSVERILEKAAGGDRQQFLAANYFLRYLAGGAFVFVIYLTKIIPVVAVLLGLSAFAVAVVIEGLILLFSSISKREEF